MKRRISIFVIACILFSLITPLYSDKTSKAAEIYGEIYNVSADTYVNFRKAPNGELQLDNNGGIIKLTLGYSLKILDTTNNIWYKVQISYNGVDYTGYVSSTYIKIVDKPSNNDSQQSQTPPTSNDVDFETYMNQQGFPESYKAQLRVIHAQHPNWKFKAVQTGIDWSTLVKNEISTRIPAKNVLYCSSTAPHYNWRSTSVGYNWATDTWSPSDGKTFFAASDELVAYYLDPRTYLYENYIFAFESLAYDPNIQTEAGVNAIIAGTFMSGVVPAGETKTYSQIIMQAAAASGVSPYHIAARIKLEMGGTGATIAATGKSKTNPGIYNFYNIGAVDTPGGSPAEKGVNWAAQSGDYGRPWNSVSKSIINGASYIGASYITPGQNTVYYQKFNVVNKKSGLFAHQYMTNVQCPATEAITAYNAYKNMGMLDAGMVFLIPVYLNMPSTPVAKPADSGNPNNWLKSLSVDGYTLTPTFAINTTNEYTLIVPDNVASVNIKATTVNSSAKISGIGTINLSSGTNKVYVNVTAQNGKQRTYTVTIVKGNATGGVSESGVNSGGNSTVTLRKGDLNGDGKTSAIDLVMVQRLIMGIDVLSSDKLKAADVNGDGKISAIDLVKIQRHIMGIETIQ